MANRIISKQSPVNTIMESKDSCPICCENYNSSRRSKVTCPFCPETICKECARTYLVNYANDAHCMTCKKQWDREFLQNALNKSFYNGVYKDHRKRLLFETEKARIPETMPAVENYKKVADLTKQEDEARIAVANAQVLLRQAKENLYVASRNLRMAKNGQTVGGEKKEARAFIKKCPRESCEGYLSTQWKCGACNVWCCPHCEEEIGFDKNDPHECDPNTVATAALVKKETKPCPSCHIPIFKISGCDQMWCTVCKVAFSWRTGARVNGVIHNPHFYEYQRSQGENAVQNPGVFNCGGLPDYYYVRNAIRHWPERNNTRERIVMNLLRGAQHFMYTILNPMRTQLQNNRDNQDLRIKFVVKEIDEKNFKTQIMKRETKNQKQQRLIHIYELMGTVFTEVMNAVYNDIRQRKKFSDINEHLYKINRVRKYCNVELMKLSLVFNQCVSIITDHFDTDSINSKRCKAYLAKKEPGNFRTKKDNHGYSMRRDNHRGYVYYEDDQ